jgi:hypothetical protein
MCSFVGHPSAVVTRASADFKPEQEALYCLRSIAHCKPAMGLHVISEETRAILLEQVRPQQQ